MDSFMSDGAEMLDQDYRNLHKWASSADDVTLGAVLKKTGWQATRKDVKWVMLVSSLSAQILATQRQVANGNVWDICGFGVGKKAARMAGSGLAKGIGRVVPGFSVAGNVMDVADIVTGDESLANKAMDTTAMVGGGVIGSVGGPLGASIGASTGKMISDGTQWLFGDKKTPEQRKMEEALKSATTRRINLMSTVEVPQRQVYLGLTIGVREVRDANKS